MDNGSNTRLSSPSSEKRVVQNVITPNVEERSNKKAKYDFKTTHDVVPKNLMSNVCEGYMISLKANVDLFYFEQGQTEAFVNPVVELLLGKKNDTHNWRIQKEQLSKISKIIAVVPRRKSWKEDEPEYKFNPTKNDPNAKFKKHYFVSYDPKRSTKQDKKERLESVLTVRRNIMMSLLTGTTIVTYQILQWLTYYCKNSTLNSISVIMLRFIKRCIMVMMIKRILSSLKIMIKHQRNRNVGIRESWMWM